MAGQRQTDVRTDAGAGSSTTLKRRGILAAAAAALAAIVAKQAAEPVAAGIDGDVVLGGVNTTASDTYITDTLSSGTALTLTCNAGVDGWGLSANGSGYGVIGRSNIAGGVSGGAGVYGTTSRANSYGVQGNNDTGIGVYGTSATNVGVFGVSAGGSGQPYGVVGSVNAAPGFGLFGVTNVAGTVGFAGGAGVAGAIAGQFAGPVNIYNNGAITRGDLFIQGNYTALGTKSAAVPHPDGTHRLLYCVESPEAWFEDFGEGTITGGKAEVKLDADFAAVVDTSKLHVFVTEHDTTHHLAVTARAGSSFSVGAAPSTTAAAGTKASELSGTFSYRVVAKRKDVKADRLAKYAVPQEIKAATPLVIPTPSKGETKPVPGLEPPKKA